MNTYNLEVGPSATAWRYIDNAIPMSLLSDCAFPVIGEIRKSEKINNMTLILSDDLDTMTIFLKYIKPGETKNGVVYDSGELEIPNSFRKDASGNALTREACSQELADEIKLNLERNFKSINEKYKPST